MFWQERRDEELRADARNALEPQSVKSCDSDSVKNGSDFTQVKLGGVLNLRKNLVLFSGPN